MGDRELALLNIFKTHFPNGNCDDFTRKNHARDLLHFDYFGVRRSGRPSQITRRRVRRSPMNKRNVIIAVVTVVLLAVVYFVVFQPDSSTEESAAPAPAATTESGG